MELNLLSKFFVVSTLSCIFLLGAMSTNATSQQQDEINKYYGLLSWRTYFGDPLPNLSEEDLISFNRGFLSFTTPFETDNSVAKNANSCVECHSIPMPGGSGGIVPVAKVGIDTSVPSGSILEVLQNNHNLSSKIKPSFFNRTPALFGIGLIERASLADKNRFGIFLNSSSIHEVVSKALATELGVSTRTHCARKIWENYYPENCLPDVEDDVVNDLTFYLQNLAPPRGYSNSLGLQVFIETGCSSCHQPALTADLGEYGSSNSTIFYPYSDFKVHDLGSGISIRTSPLWGLSSYTPPYMSNGEIFEIEDVIKLHGGEASEVSNKYFSLSDREKNLIIDFLNSI